MYPRVVCLALALSLILLYGRVGVKAAVDASFPTPDSDASCAVEGRTFRLLLQLVDGSVGTPEIAAYEQDAGRDWGLNRTPMNLGAWEGTRGCGSSARRRLFIDRIISFPMMSGARVYVRAPFRPAVAPFCVVLACGRRRALGSVKCRRDYVDLRLQSSVGSMLFFACLDNVRRLRTPSF